MTTSSIVKQPEAGRDRELTRVSGIHNHLKTWAVHDDRVCVYLAVTPNEHIYAGVFRCIAVTDEYVSECPWLGSCDTDAYGRAIARPIYEQAADSGFDESVIYGLLEQLHASEVTR